MSKLKKKSKKKSSSFKASYKRGYRKGYMDGYNLAMRAVRDDIALSEVVEKNAETRRDLDGVRQERAKKANSQALLRRMRRRRPEADEE